MHVLSYKRTGSKKQQEPCPCVYSQIYSLKRNHVQLVTYKSVSRMMRQLPHHCIQFIKFLQDCLNLSRELFIFRKLIIKHGFIAVSFLVCPNCWVLPRRKTTLLCQLLQQDAMVCVQAIQKWNSSKYSTTWKTPIQARNNCTKTSHGLFFSSPVQHYLAELLDGFPSNFMVHPSIITTQD